MFPISMWVPHEYPRTAPIAFVTPTRNMAVRPGQYVSVEGRVYHPYLAGWKQDVSRSLFPSHHDQLLKVSAKQNSWLSAIFWLNRLHGSGVVLLNYSPSCKKCLPENHPSSRGKRLHRIHRRCHQRPLPYHHPSLPYPPSLEDPSRCPVREDHRTNRIRPLVHPRLPRTKSNIVLSKPTEHLLSRHTQADRSLKHLVRPYMLKWQEPPCPQSATTSIISLSVWAVSGTITHCLHNINTSKFINQLRSHLIQPIGQQLHLISHRQAKLHTVPFTPCTVMDHHRKCSRYQRRRPITKTNGSKIRVLLRPWARHTYKLPANPHRSQNRRRIS